MFKNLVNFLKKMLTNDKVTYIIAGGCTTLVNLGVFALLRYAGFFLSVTNNIISVACAIVFAFLVNKIFVFRSKSDTLSEWFQEFFKFVGGRLSTMAIEVGGVCLLYEIMGVNEMLSKFATQFIVLLINYFISKFIVFKE